jgi:hypothetical protein
MRKRLLIVILILLLAATGTAFALRGVIRDAVAARMKPALPPAEPYHPPAEEEPAPAPGPTPSPAPVPTPSPAPAPAPAPKPAASKGVNLAVPFTSQAPHADWSMPYQEACEEASLVMVNAFFKDAGPFTPDEADRQILALVEWEKTKFGFYEDTTADEVATMAQEYYGYARSRAVPIASIAEVKKQLDKGLPVLLPSAGRLLHNPYFSGAGPLYHMLVAKGYTKDGKIIVNDPGTRRGADYLYDADTLWNAIHDWNGGDVEHGRKVMIVVEK